MIFIAVILRKDQGVNPGPNGSCATRKRKIQVDAPPVPLRKF